MQGRTERKITNLATLLMATFFASKSITLPQVKINSQGISLRYETTENGKQTISGESINFWPPQISFYKYQPTGFRGMYGMPIPKIIFYKEFFPSLN